MLDVGPPTIVKSSAPLSETAQLATDSEHFHSERQEVKPINELPVAGHLIRPDSRMERDSQKLNDYNSGELYPTPTRIDEDGNNAKAFPSIIVGRAKVHQQLGTNSHQLNDMEQLSISNLNSIEESRLYSSVPLAFNYANKKSLKPTTLSSAKFRNGRDVGERMSGSDVALNNRELSRVKRMSLIKGDHDYLETSGTKDLITEEKQEQNEREDSRRRKNIVVRDNEAKLNGRKGLAGRSQLHPTVIDDVQTRELSSSIINGRILGGRLVGESFPAATPVESFHDEPESIGAIESYDSTPRLDISNWMTAKEARGQRNDPSEESKRSSEARDKSQNAPRGHLSQPESLLNEPGRAQLYSFDHDDGGQFFSDTSNSKETTGIQSEAEVNEQTSLSVNGNKPSTLNLYGSTQSKPELTARSSDIGPIPDKQRPLSDELDESLMWTASQYLYMRMKASVSSIFGVEVDVEWSNERANTTNAELQEALNANRNPDAASNHRYARDQTLRAHSSVPFATIDVISGQNLRLECTAQALGRLPEVRWYKRITTIPTKAKHFINLARKIANELYWPLTELDLLKEDRRKRNKSFVCSESTTIFDNLANQTFTVINSLQLTQYNEIIQPETLRLNPLTNDNYNLYACIVDADVRHNFATLGVYYREAPRQIPFEISKRLRARSASVKNVDQLNRHPAIRNKISEVNPKDFNEGFDLFRDNSLNFPMKSYWIPITNGSSKGYDLGNAEEFKLTPMLLSIIIMLVFGSLLALIYLTLHSYKALSQLHYEEELNDRLAEAPNQFVDDLKNEGILIDPQTDVTKPCQCLSETEFGRAQDLIIMSRSNSFYMQTTIGDYLDDDRKLHTPFYDDHSLAYNYTRYSAESSFPSTNKEIRNPNWKFSQNTLQENSVKYTITLPSKNSRHPKEFNL